MVLNAFLMSKCFGIGLCNNIPCISFLLLSFSIIARSCCIVISSFRINSSNSIPTSLHALLLFRTYTSDALSFPTIITANLGQISSCFRLFTSSFNFFIILLANNLPSIIFAIFLPFSIKNLAYILQYARFFFNIFF